MPELPDVEHVRRHLASWLVGTRIDACSVVDARLTRPVEPRAFAKAVVGRRVENVDRRGKWLRIVLDDDTRLFSHLGMTGWWNRALDDEPLRFERARITVRSGKSRKPTHVVYTDARRWGHLLLAHADIESWTSLASDPLIDDIDAGELRAKLARRKKSSIKVALLDQTVLAGIGNIHAIEALWRAHIHPRSTAAALTEKDVRALLRAIDWTIERALLDLEKGEHGQDDPWVIYGHAGRPCPRCGRTLARTELAGRTTTFCNGCQRLLE